MSERRKPVLTIVASKPGKNGQTKRYRAELFPCSLWPKKYRWGSNRTKYRIRVNGKWWKGDPVTKSEFFSLLRKSLVR